MLTLKEVIKLIKKSEYLKSDVVEGAGIYTKLFDFYPPQNDYSQNLVIAFLNKSMTKVVVSFGYQDIFSSNIKNPTELRNLLEVLKEKKEQSQKQIKKQKLQEAVDKAKELIDMNP